MRENQRMTHRIIPAIMSGGAGTRLWPLSTDAQPKQFHALAGDESLFATTAKRVRGIVGDVSFAPPIVLCNETHLAMARQELGGEAAAFVLEPVPRNTAAVGAIAAAVAAELDPDALVLLLPRTPASTLARVHAPLLASSLSSAALLLFVDVMKELPATFALRPFNFDTLAIEAYNLAKDERLAEAAVPSLVIVAVGLLPVIYVSKRYFQATRS